MAPLPLTQKEGKKIEQLFVDKFFRGIGI